MTQQQGQYEQWVTEHSEPLYRLAARLCGNADAAEDLVQETFYHAWRSMASLREPDRARGWLFRILRRRYSRWLRDQTRRLDRIGTTDSAFVADKAASDGQPGAAMEREELLQRALEVLEERYKLPLLLVFLVGMTFQEAADSLDLPLGTVLSRVHRARQQIRQQFDTERSGIRLVGDSVAAMAPADEARHPHARRQTGGIA